MRRTFPRAKALRETVKKKRRRDGAQDGHTRALVTGPFKCFPTMKASTSPPTLAQTVQREVLLEVRRRVRSHKPQLKTGSAEGLVSKGPLLHTHPHSRVTSRPALESGFFFSVYPEQIPQMKVLFLVGGEGGAGAGLW